MIRFTIVTITYNAAQVLQPTLDSVLAQTYPNVEHWIIDGKSADDTVAMAEDYRRQTEQQRSCHVVCIQSEPDRGLYDAMNKGLALATGDYIVFLNAGDAFPSADTLQHVADCVKPGEPLPGVLYGFTDIVDSQRRFLCHRLICRGARFAGVCLSAIRRSMPGPTWRRTIPTTCATASRPMWTGASV